jgi:hypothetical protein
MKNYLAWLCLCNTTQLGYLPASPPNPVWYASLLALIPAFIGAYSGALSRVILNSAW